MALTTEHSDFQARLTAVLSDLGPMLGFLSPEEIAARLTEALMPFGPPKWRMTLIEALNKAKVPNNLDDLLDHFAGSVDTTSMTAAEYERFERVARNTKASVRNQLVDAILAQEHTMAASYFLISRDPQPPEDHYS